MTQDQSPHERLVATLQARLEVARAATPGPWIYKPTQYGDPYVDAAGGETIAAFTHAWPEGPIPLEAPDAAYIAANDPATEIRRVEALLRVVEAYREAVAFYNALIVALRLIAAGEGIEP